MTTTKKHPFEIMQEAQKEREHHMQVMQQAFKEAYQSYIKQEGRIYEL